MEIFLLAAVTCLVIMGIGLTSKFSTSVISENILFSTGLITQPFYSALMAAFIILKPIIVGGFSRGLAVSRDTMQQKYQAVVVETAGGE